MCGTAASTTRARAHSRMQWARTFSSVDGAQLAAQAVRSQIVSIELQPFTSSKSSSCTLMSLPGQTAGALASRFSEATSRNFEGFEATALHGMRRTWRELIRAHDTYSSADRPPERGVQARDRVAAVRMLREQVHQCRRLQMPSSAS